MDHDPQDQTEDRAAEARAVSSSGTSGDGIITPGERLLQQEVEELMAKTPPVPEDGTAAPRQPVKSVPAPQGPAPQSVPSPTPQPAAPTAAPKETTAVPPSPPASESPEPKTFDLGETDHTPTAKQDRESAIRTYYGDVADVVRSQQTSMADIAIAEQRRREETATSDMPEEKTRSGLSAFLTVLGIVLILAGAGVVGYVYVLKPAMPTASVPIITDTLIPADNEADFDITNLTRSELLSTLETFRESLPGDAGDVTVLRPRRTATLADESTESVDVGSREFLNLFATHIDQPFLRSVEPDYMVGFHRLPAGANEPFLILTTSFFENAFAGLLRWEPFMADDLPFLAKRIVVPQPAPVAETATTSTPTPEATTTSEEIMADSGPYVFTDMVIANRDTRVLENKAGTIKMLYSFPRRDLLIITSNPETFKELLNRLAAIQFRG